ncbi:hypothetical protein [uncultured Psychrobacter sp.]|uniref:hypothetical protein n=1 Tax=uncultured Psychrobacter sp. TaxID=259303 RepID=UPI0034580E40
MNSSEIDSKIVKAAKWLEKNFLDYLKNYEGLLFLVVSIFIAPNLSSIISELYEGEDIDYRIVFSSYSLYIFVLLVILYLISTYFFNKRQSEIHDERLRINSKITNLEEEISKKENENKELERSNLQMRSQINEAQEAITSLKIKHLNDSIDISSKFLAFIFHKLELNAYDRISIYRLVKIEEKDIDFLHIFGRYSVNEKYKSISRREFPKSQGIIGAAFEKDNLEIEILPENDDDYFEAMKDYNIPKGVAKNFAMKSRTLYPYLITIEYGERVGVLVIESISHCRSLNKDSINDTLKQYDSIFLQLLEYNYNILKNIQSMEDGT